MGNAFHIGWLRARRWPCLPLLVLLLLLRVRLAGAITSFVGRRTVRGSGSGTLRRCLGNGPSRRRMRICDRSSEAWLGRPHSGCSGGGWSNFRGDGVSDSGVLARGNFVEERGGVPHHAAGRQRRQSRLRWSKRLRATGSNTVAASLAVVTLALLMLAECRSD
jgi:hypothetical protein